MDFKNFFTRKKKDDIEKRDVNCSCNCYGSGNLMFGGLGNNFTALNVAITFRCVALISQTIASLPIYVQNKEHEILYNHPVSLVFRDKSGNVMSKYDMMKQLITNVLLNGNGYLFIERNQGIVTNLRYLQASDVHVNYKKEIGKVTYTCSYIRHGADIPATDMCHFKLYSFDGVNGISILNYASRSIAVANNIENTAASYYKNNGLLSGIITYQGNLSQVQQQQIKENWDSTYGNGASGIAVLGGGLQFQALSSNAADTQINESRTFSVEDICRFFGVPSVLVGINGSSFSTFESVQQLFLTNCIQPYIVMLEREFDRKLFPEDDLYVNIEENSMLRCDKINQANYYGIMVDKGIMSREEVREELGLKKVEGLDKFIIPYTDTAQNTINQNNVLNEEEEDDKEAV